MSNPAISIVMVDGSFRESFHSIRFFCSQTLPADQYELLWVEYYDRVNPALRAEIERFPQARLITVGQSGSYQPSQCFNAGIVAARGEVLVIPDADLVAERDLLEQVWREHEASARLVMYLYRYEEAQADHIAEITLEHLRAVCRLRYPMNCGACLTARKRWLLEINGYDHHPAFREHSHAHGNDVHARLKVLGLPIAWHPRIRLYHPWHPFTLTPARIAYARQVAVSNWRERALNPLAFMGIEPARNTPFPDELVAELDRLRAGNEATAGPSMGAPPRRPGIR